MKKIINVIKKFLKNDIVERCYKTFFQAFIGVLLTIQIADIHSVNSIKTLLISAITAGVCAVWNILKEIINKKLNNE